MMLGLKHPDDMGVPGVVQLDVLGRVRHTHEYGKTLPIDGRFLTSSGSFGSDPERACRLKMALEGLSAEAREVVETVLNTPDELVEFVVGKGTRRELTAADVRAWLRWKGWRWKSISIAFAEVRKIFNVL